MLRKVEPILVIRQEFVILLRKKLTIVGVLAFVRVKYDKPRFSQQNGSIVRGVLKDWNKEIHSMNRVPRLISPCCTYYH
jgi:hypothetical protein